MCVCVCVMCVSVFHSCAAEITDGSQYFVLLMITDGVISDMVQTKEAVVNVSRGAHTHTHTLVKCPVNEMLSFNHAKTRLNILCEMINTNVLLPFRSVVVLDCC